MKTDKELRQSVIDELNFEPSIDAAGIGVTAEQGVITLTGHVPTFGQKVIAERAVWRVKGVKAVAQQLEVRLAADKKTHDDEIAKRALSVLAWNTSVPDDAIKIQVQKGLITLSGSVDWNYQREAAEKGLRDLNGVVGLINSITVKPSVQPTDVKRRIAEALERHAEVEASKIRVDVKEGGTVSLSGEVDSWDERQAAFYAAWSAPGVSKVTNNLRIS